MKLIYIHTMGGKLAGFAEKQICFANKPRKNGWHPKACNSIVEIKEQQKRSNEYRKSKGYELSNYGYRIVEVDT